MLAVNRESVWREHRPDLVLSAAAVLLAVYFAYFVQPWAPGSCSLFTLHVFFWASILAAWTIAVLRLVVGIAFHRLAITGTMLLLAAMFVVNLALLAVARTS